MRLNIMRKNILGRASKREFDTIGRPLNHFKPIAMRMYQFDARCYPLNVFKTQCKFHPLDELDLNAFILARFRSRDSASPAASRPRLSLSYSVERQEESSMRHERATAK